MPMRCRNQLYEPLNHLRVFSQFSLSDSQFVLRFGTGSKTFDFAVFDILGAELGTILRALPPGMIYPLPFKWVSRGNCLENVKL